MTLVLFIGAIVIFVLTKKFLAPFLMKGKLAKVGGPITWFILGSCAIVAGWAFFSMGIGQLIARVTGTVIGWVGEIAAWAFDTPAPPVRTISALILLALFVVVVVDIVIDRKVDGPAITAWFVMPIFLFLTPGAPLGGLLTTIYQRWEANGMTVLGWLGAG